MNLIQQKGKFYTDLVNLFPRCKLNEVKKPLGFVSGLEET